MQYNSTPRASTYTPPPRYPRVSQPAPQRADSYTRAPQSAPQRPDTRPHAPQPASPRPNTYPRAPHSTPQRPDTYPRAGRPPSAPERPRRPAEPPPPSRRGSHLTDTRLVLLLAALASTAAGIVHAAAIPAHWTEWPLAGWFFALVAVFQVGWAVLLFAFGNRVLVVSGIAANAGLVLLWAVSRWQGLPFGPHGGMPEAVGFADALTSVLEAWIALSLLWSLLPRVTHGVLAIGGYRLAAALAGAFLGLTLIPGIGSALSHGGEGHTHEESEEDGHHHDGTEEEGHDHGAETSTPESSEPEASESASEAPQEEDHTHAPGEEHD